MFSKVKINEVLVIVFGVIIIVLIMSKPNFIDIFYLFILVIYMISCKFIK